MKSSLSRKSFIQRVALGTAALSVGGLPALVSGCGGGKKDGDNAGLPLLGEGCVNAASPGANGGRAASRYKVDVTFTSVSPSEVSFQSSRGTYPIYARLNNLGEVTGYEKALSLVRWQNGVLTRLDRPDLIEFGFGHDINDQGRVIGSFGGPNTNTSQDSLVWNRDGSFVVLQRPQGLDPFEVLHPTSINNCGLVVGKTLTAGADNPLIWDAGDGRLVTEVSLPEDRKAEGECRINDANQIAFYAHGTGPTPVTRTLYLLDKGNLTSLGVPDGLEGFAVPVALNNQGRLLIFSSDRLDPAAFLWQSGTDGFLRLDPPGGLLGARFDGAALNDGNLIVGSAYNYWGSLYQPPRPVGVKHSESGKRTSTAVLWDAGQFIDLNERIDPSLGVELFFGWDINNAGQILAYGRHTVEDRTAEYVFLLTPEA